jgi:hypothetical protein
VEPSSGTWPKYLPDRTRCKPLRWWCSVTPENPAHNVQILGRGFGPPTTSRFFGFYSTIPTIGLMAGFENDRSVINSD